MNWKLHFVFVSLKANSKPAILKLQFTYTSSISMNENPNLKLYEIGCDVMGDTVLCIKIPLMCLRYELVCENLGGISEAGNDLYPGLSLLCQRSHTGFPSQSCVH